MDWDTWLRSAQPFINSQIVGTIIAAAFGAFGGALGAQAIISRGQKKQRAVTELNSIRAAVMICFSICNTFLALKRQHVQPLQDNYMEGRKSYDEFLKLRKENASSDPIIYHLLADLQTIAHVRVPDSLLEDYMFKSISHHGRALAAAVELTRAIDGLKDSIDMRNALIEEVRRQSPIPAQKLAELYFGLKGDDGSVDSRFADNICAIYNEVNDCIFFSRLLGEDLIQYGKNLRRRYRWRLWIRMPKLPEVDWSKAERLLPPSTEYKDWLRGFKEQPSKSRRLIGYLKSWRAHRGAATKP